jgi:hypothetical protein
MIPADLVNTLRRTLGLSFAAGINLYATVAVIGLASRFGWVELPPQYRVFDNNWIIGVAVFLYLVEFLADDSLQALNLFRTGRSAWPKTAS